MRRKTTSLTVLPVPHSNIEILFCFSPSYVVTKSTYSHRFLMSKYVAIVDNVPKNDTIWIDPKKTRLHLVWQNLIKLLERCSELSSNLSNKQHYFAQQNVLQNIRHKSVDSQCKISEFTPWDISILCLLRILEVFCCVVLVLGYELVRRLYRQSSTYTVF